MNWDVDIAQELEEYAQELQAVTVSFDQGVSKLNFAEAALLIQGSALIYSRKVEYLYTLAYQTLELVAEKRYWFCLGEEAAPHASTPSAIGGSATGWRRTRTRAFSGATWTSF